MVGGWVMPMGPLRVYNKHSEDILLYTVVYCVRVLHTRVLHTNIHTIKLSPVATFCSTSIKDAASTIHISVIFHEISDVASGRSSKKPTYSIAPAANPSPTGSHGSAADTSMNTGMATKGWGRLEKIAHPVADTKDTPRGMSTTAMARPSGTLWMASDMEMKDPSL